MTMDNDRFYAALAEILEVESVGDGDVLREFESWDSLTRLSIIAMAESDYRTVLSAKDLEGLATVGQLKAFLDGNSR